MTTTTPGGSFVRIRHDDPDGHHVTTTIRGAHGADPDVAGHGVLAALADRDADVAGLVRDELRQLTDRDAEMMAWLMADPAHTELFVRDPVTAIRTAIPDLADAVAGWTTLGASNETDVAADR